MAGDLNSREAFLQMVERRSDVDSRFTDIRRLGPSGGNGTFSLLFSAMDITSRKRIALKVYDPVEKNAYRWACFEREEEILRSLAGQSDIIRWIAPRSQFSEPVTAGGIRFQLPFNYYALELATGNVADVIAAAAWNTERNLVAFRAMCRAVQRIRSHGIAHRDLKPDNFLMMANGEVKLSDFGTACRLDGTIDPLLRDYGTFHPGDMRYVAPEMLAGIYDEDHTIALGADIFALGAILFELFSGTILGLQIFDSAFMTDLKSCMTAVPAGRRRHIYHQFVGSLAAGHPLPSLASFGTNVPSSICMRLDRLYQSMAALDYRHRFLDFHSIFHQINICLQIVRNETKYLWWLREREKRLHKPSSSEMLATVQGEGL